eukprot:scaffold7473_cov141-Skeletonema_marinoi.AAC.24
MEDSVQSDQPIERSGIHRGGASGNKILRRLLLYRLQNPSLHLDSRARESSVATAMRIISSLICTICLRRPNAASQ